MFLFQANGVFYFIRSSTVKKNIKSYFFSRLTRTFKDNSIISLAMAMYVGNLNLLIVRSVFTWKY